MGHGKETPRQKMIGMMYLVLTAMLALNVSSDILNGFVLVDNGLVKTTANFAAKNESSYRTFEDEMAKTPEKVRPFRDKAFSVKEMADKLVYDLQELKVEIVKYCDGENAPALSPVEWTVGKTYTIDNALINAKDNLDKPADIMINKGKGEELKKKIEAFREQLLSMTDDASVQKAINESLNTDAMVDRNGTPLSWESGHFEFIPMIAVVTMLSKMQSDVRNAEADIINNLLAQIGASDTKVNKMEAIVQAKSSYILRGNEYEARILLAAYDSLQKPEILIGTYRKTETGYEIPGGGRKLEYDARGRAIYKASGSSVGNFNLQGLLQMAGPDGITSYPFSADYQVGESQIVFSPTKMNVLYIGVDNPIVISMSGVGPDKISAGITNGTITRSGSEWIAKPATSGESTITASATVEGKPVSGNMKFRVKMLPTPIAKIGGRAGGPIDKNVLVGQTGVNAELEDFLFDLRYQVTQFNVVAVTTAGEQAAASTSPAFTDQQKALINRLTKGQKLFITGIKARLVGGNVPAVDLRDIVFTIN